MAVEAKPGILINQSRIALALSVIALLSFGFQASKFFIDTNYRISSLEEKWVAMEGTQKDLATELKNLNAVIGDLNLVLREVQVRIGDKKFMELQK